MAEPSPIEVPTARSFAGSSTGHAALVAIIVGAQLVWLGALTWIVVLIVA
jgi:hypothetical protein